MCLSALLAVGAVFGAPATKRAPAQNPSRPEGKPIVVNPKAAVSMRPVRGSLGIEAGTAGRQRITTGMSLPKAPERIGASGSTVYGNLVYDAGWNYPNSITEMFSDGRITSLIEPPQGSMGGDVQIVVIYVREGKMHCLAQETFWGETLLGNYEFVYDLETGELVSSNLYGEQEIMFNYAGYDPANDILYGYVEATNGMFFCTASGANPRVFTSVTRMPDDAIHVACMTYNQVSGKLIGFASSKFDGKIIEISTTDGSQTEIGTLTDISDYITGLCYSPWDEAYWYAVCSNSTCAIQLLDPDDFSVISSSPYASLMEFCGMACPDRRKIPASAPGESTLVNSIFADIVNSCG